MDVKDCFANRHFLVVDDEAFIRTVVSRFLRGSGAASVVEAADGGSALRAMANYGLTFAAVISDINMQPVNGIELLRAIRTGQDGVKRSTPVLMLTVHSEVGLVAEAVALDADAFVLKPIRREDLIERVYRILEQPVPVEPAAHYATAAQNIALDDVLVNSILAGALYAGDTSKQLFADTMVLTQPVLDRIKDLHRIYGTYSHLSVIEPRDAMATLVTPPGAT